MRLTFPAVLVRSLLDHSVAAATRFPVMDQLFQGAVRKDGKDVDLDNLPIEAWPKPDEVDTTKVPPGLVLVGDQGVYMMSNGEPPLLAGEGSPHRRVAYAAECNPQTQPGWYDVKVASFGGDDGTVFLERSFVEAALLRTDRSGFFPLDVTPDDVTVPVIPRRRTR